MTTVLVDQRFHQWFVDCQGIEVIVTNERDAQSDNIDTLSVSDWQGVMTLFEPVLDNRESPKRRIHQIDIAAFLAQQHSYPSSKKNLLGQAVGRKTETVLDATAGWGGDALHLLAQGFQVSVAERNGVLQGFLQEAFYRLAKSQWAIKHSIAIQPILFGDSIQLMVAPDFLNTVDCIYLDPMFPEKRKRSALAKKNMQFLQRLIGADDDQEALFAAAFSAARRRVVVKRPDYAPSLGSTVGVAPSQTVRGKLINYDIYLKH